MSCISFLLLSITNKPLHKNTFSIGKILWSADSFVVTVSSVFGICIYGQKPAHINSEKSWFEKNKFLNFISINKLFVEVN